MSIGQKEVKIMKTRDTKAFINIIEDELNAVTFNAVRHVISYLNNGKDCLSINYIVYDDYSILYVIEVTVRDMITFMNCNIHNING